MLNPGHGNRSSRPLGAAARRALATLLALTLALQGVPVPSQAQPSASPEAERAVAAEAAGDAAAPTGPSAGADAAAAPAGADAPGDAQSPSDPQASDAPGSGAGAAATEAAALTAETAAAETADGAPPAQAGAAGGTAADAEPASPALSVVSVTDLCVTVDVRAPEGAFPEGTVALVRDVRRDDVADRVAPVVEGDPCDVRAVDISFVCGGREVEPADGRRVEVSVRPSLPVAGSSFSVVHLPDSGEPEVVPAAADARGARFSADSFSVYAIVGSTDPNTYDRVRLTFRNGGIVARQIVREGDSIDFPVPAAKRTGELIYHWLAGPESARVDLEDAYPGPLSAADVEALKVLGVESVDGDEQELWDVEANASWSRGRRVTFFEYPYGTAGNVSCDSIAAAETAEPGVYSATFSDVNYIRVDEDAKLYGWLRFDAEGHQTNAYSTSDTITLTEDVSLYPDVRSGVWVRLSTGDDATPCDNVFAPAGEGGAKTLSFADLPAPGSEAAPTRRGYAFAGWYTDPSCADDTRVTADYTFAENSKTLYAKWVPGDTTFSVVVWVEDGSGGPQHLDADQSDLSKYTAYGCWEFTGTTGQSATVAKADGNEYAIKVLAGDATVGGPIEPVEASDPTHHRYYLRANQPETSATLAADGSTTLNVYFNRWWWTCQYWSNDQRTLLLEVPMKWGQDYSKTLVDNNLVNYPSPRDSYGFRQDNGEFVWNHGGGALPKYKEYPYVGDKRGLGVVVYYRQNDGMAFSQDLTDMVEVFREAKYGETPTHRTTLQDGTPIDLVYEPERTVGVKNVELPFDAYEGHHVFKYESATARDHGPNQITWISDDNTGMRRFYTSWHSRFDGTMGWTISEYNKLKSYTIGFHNLGSGEWSTVDDSTQKFGWPVLASTPDFSAATRTGDYGETLTFLGWFRGQADAEDAEEHLDRRYTDADMMPSHNLSLYAGWKRPQFTCTFVTGEGATPVAPVEGLHAGDHVAAPATSRENSILQGWYQDEAMTVPWDFTSNRVTNSDVTLYAKWVPSDPVTLRYHRADGTHIEGLDEELYSGANVLLATAEDAGVLGEEGSEFLGWSTVRDDSSHLVPSAYVVDADTDLYAVSQDVPLPGGPTVRLMSNYPAKSDGAGSDVALFEVPTDIVNDQVGVTADRVPDPSQAPVASGVTYVFGGWNTAADASGTTYRAGDYMGVAGDTDLFAVWLERYPEDGLDHLAYVKNAGADDDKVSGGIDFTTGETYSSVAVAAGFDRVGYEFLGWNTKADGTGAPYAPGATYRLTPEDDVLYAQWRIKSFDVTYSYEGDVPPEPPALPAARSVTYGEGVAVESAPSQTGYTFSGWRTSDADVAGGLFAMPGNPVSFVGTWTINTHEVTYAYEGAVPHDAPAPPAAATHAFGSAVTVAAAPALDGYVFGGWRRGSVGATNFSMPDEDVRITGSWTPRRYAITFDSAGGSPVDPIEADYRSPVAAPVAPSRQGYDFAGWFDGEGREFSFPTTMPLGGASLTARWTPRSDTPYVVSLYYQADGVYTAPEATESRVGTTESTVGVTDADKVPAREGYALDETRGSAWAGTVAADGTLRLAVYFKQQFRVSFVPGLHGTFAEQSTDALDWGAITPAAPASPAADDEGYSFNGWRSSNDGRTYDAGALPATVTGDVTYEAMWTPNDYTLEYLFVGDVPAAATAPAFQFVTYRTDATVAPAPAAVAGYTFGGWAIDGEPVEPGSTFTMPSDPVTVTGTWSINSYTISFDAAGGTPVDSISQNYATAITRPDNPAREGHEFVCWEDAETGLPADVPTNMPARDVRLRARWRVLSYQVSYAYDGAAPATAPAAPAGTLKEFASTVAVASAPTAVGYDFGGWSTTDATVTAGSFTMPARGVSFSGSWTIRRHDVAYAYEGDVPEDAQDLPAPATYDYDAPVALAAEPAAVPGYTFSGWRVEGDPASDFSMPDADVRVVGTWTIDDDSLTLDPNSTFATGDTAAVEGKTFSGVRVPDTGFAWEHHEFVGWNTEPDGTGDAYLPGSIFTLTPDADVLYAQWDPNAELRYDGNGATGEPPAPQFGHSGDSVVVSDCRMDYPDHRFLGWNTAADGSGGSFAPGDEFVLAAAGDTLFAQWAPVPVPGSLAQEVRPDNFGGALVAEDDAYLAEAVPLTEEEAAAVASGADARFWVEVADVTGSVSAADRAALHDAIGDAFEPGLFLDVTTWVSVGDLPARRLTRLARPVTVTLGLPSALADGRELAVARSHGGRAERIDGALSGATLAFGSDRFSLFEVAYATAVDGQRATSPDASSSVRLPWLPRTGDASPVAACALIGLLGASALALGRRRRRSR
ncbi:InlB B-repeat-containing protein [Olsenella intestinalis]|uniref:InlB B-repeat-containing protein n=1 Tax=Olsenella intestinalis TaxID=2930083 RepID=UPI00201052C5